METSDNRGWRSADSAAIRAVSPGDSHRRRFIDDPLCWVGRFAEDNSYLRGRRRRPENARTLMYEAAVVILTRLKRASSLKDWRHAIARRSGNGKAQVAVALPVILHSVWRLGDPAGRSTQTPPDHHARKVHPNEISGPPGVDPSRALTIAVSRASRLSLLIAGFAWTRRGPRRFGVRWISGPARAAARDRSTSRTSASPTARTQSHARQTEPPATNPHSDRQ
jgi:hypothetical protein